MRLPAAAVALISALALPLPAFAWTDARPAGLVTELAVDRDGGATVTLRMRWRVLAGRFRTFDLADLPADFALLEATASDATGNAVTVATRVPAPGRLEVTLGEDGGLRRGALDVVIRYTTSLRAQGAIRRANGDAVMEVATVPWERGLEAAEIRVALPASVRRAQWLGDDTPGIDATVTSEVGRDVVHAMRRHLPAGARWTGHVACDPTLFAWLDGPRAAAIARAESSRRSYAPVAGLAAGLALALGGAAAAFASRRRGAALIPLPGRLSVVLPPALAGLGGAAQSLTLLNVGGAITAGAVVALAGFALTAPALRVPEASREPARVWPAARALATAVPPRRRRWVVACAVLAALAVSALVALGLARHSVLAGLAAVDLAALAIAALVAARPLEPRGDTVALGAISRALAKRAGRGGMARLAWRVRGDGRAPGAVRLRVVPRPGYRLARGVRAIECAVAWSAGALRWRATPVLIARAASGTPLERTLRLLATRAGSIEVSPDGDEIAWIADLVGPDRGVVLAQIEKLVPAALGRAPSPSPSPVARESTAREGLGEEASA